MSEPSKMVDTAIRSLMCSIFGYEDLQVADGIENALLEAFSSLKEPECLVLRLRFGLEDGRVRSLREVGREVGMTGSGVRYREQKALRKLRHPTRADFLKPFCGLEVIPTRPRSIWPSWYSK